MANADKPRGFFPVKMAGGGEVPVTRFPIAASNSTNVFVGDLVSALAGGTIQPAAVGDGDIVVGSVVSLQDSNGLAIGSPNSSVSTRYLPASTAGYAIVALAVPMAIFRCQADSGTSVAETARFATTDHVAGTGSTTTGASAHELDSSGITTGSSEQFKILDKVDEPGNDWGEHVDLLVVFQESFWFDGTAGI